jgi:hypothetical protein
MENDSKFNDTSLEWNGPSDGLFLVNAEGKRTKTDGNDSTVAMVVAFFIFSSGWQSRARYQ